MNLLRLFLGQSCAVFGFLLMFNNIVYAQEVNEDLSSDKKRQSAMPTVLEFSNSLAQVNNVFELKDVAPDDWAYEALRSLAERYGCISGFPDSTYRGTQILSRYEFAAGLNSCLNQIERSIAQSETVS